MTLKPKIIIYYTKYMSYYAIMLLYKKTRAIAFKLKKYTRTRKNPTTIYIYIPIPFALL